MATISRFSAVAAIGKLRFSGFIAWVLWLAVHLVYIIGFKHRITTLLHWAVSASSAAAGPSGPSPSSRSSRATAIERLGDAHQPHLPVGPPTSRCRPGRCAGSGVAALAERRSTSRRERRSSRGRRSGRGRSPRVAAMPLDYPIARAHAGQRAAGRRLAGPHRPDRHREPLGRRRVAARAGRTHRVSPTSSST